MDSTEVYKLPGWLVELKPPYFNTVSTFIQDRDGWIQRVKGEARVVMGNRRSMAKSVDPVDRWAWKMTGKMWREIVDGSEKNVVVPENKRYALAQIIADEWVSLENKRAERKKIAVLLLPHLKDKELMSRVAKNVNDSTSKEV